MNTTDTQEIAGESPVGLATANQPIPLSRPYDAAAMAHLHAELATMGCIAIVWTLDDVKHVAPGLSDEQAWKVLQELAGSHDAEYGVNRSDIQRIVDDRFEVTL